eukprot:TRINITY_DN429_c0_g1_i7.p1 TRINITY_DN429_c0_g1~~TRINITY_DN429_c0_g1_i7.p1  ORF type:complete len:181 (+),score=8.04 TRINITY_DN429_c0_g1_i7:715-1257(+)
MWSSLFPHHLFHAPLTRRQKSELIKGRTITLLLEDLGQAIIQYIIYNESDQNPTTEAVVTLSIFSTVFSLLFGMSEVLVESYQPRPHMVCKLVEVRDPNANLAFLNLTIAKSFRRAFDGSSETDVVIEKVEKQADRMIPTLSKDGLRRTLSSVRGRRLYWVQFYFATNRDTIADDSQTHS